MKGNHVLHSYLGHMPASDWRSKKRAGKPAKGDSAKGATDIARGRTGRTPAGTDPSLRTPEATDRPAA